MGSSFNDILKIAKKNFKETNIYKPDSSEKIPKENYLICKYLN